MKRKGLIKSIVSAVFAVLTYVALAFNFAVVSTSISGFGQTTTRSTGLSLQDWFDLLGTDAENLGMYRFARVLMVITLIVVVVVAVLAVVNVFLNNKIIGLVVRIASIVGIVVSVAFLVVFVIGGLVFGTSTTGLTIVYYPNLGSIMLGVCGAVASVMALLCTLKSKKKA